jgi:hypothetical protein
MAYLAIHGSGSVNGVSSLHGRVSRHLFEPLFYRWPTEEVPVGHVTNGVHMPSWDSAAADDLWTEACGKNRWMGVTEGLANDILKVPGDRIWQMRASARASLVDYIRQRVTDDLAADGASAQEIAEQMRLLMGDELLRIWRETGATVVLITHALDEAGMLSDRIGIMSARPGRFIDIVSTGWPRDRDSRIVADRGFGDVTARLWTRLREESLRAIGRGDMPAAATQETSRP